MPRRTFSTHEIKYEVEEVSRKRNELKVELSDVETTEEDRIFRTAIVNPVWHILILKDKISDVV